MTSEFVDGKYGFDLWSRDCLHSNRFRSLLSIFSRLRRALEFEEVITQTALLIASERLAITFNASDL